MHANHRQEIETCYSGDIGALVGLKNVTTGDTICDEEHPILLESITFPEPVISMPSSRIRRPTAIRCPPALQRLAEEDPTFRLTSNQETGQTIISGMGELHLDIIKDRMFREFNVGATAGKPQVAYRETVTKPAEGEGNLSVSPADAANTATPASCSLRAHRVPVWWWKTKLSAARSRANLLARSKTAFSKPRRPACSAVIRWWTSKSKSWTARSTKWILRNRVQDGR